MAAVQGAVAACTMPTTDAFAKEISAGVGGVFINDDHCGDWVIPLPRGLGFQTVNACSAMCFVAAGAQVFFRAESPIARAYGMLMIAVGFGSFSFHATTSLSGFLIDIVPMAITAALMLFKAVHAIQIDAGIVDKAAESTRWFISIFCAAFAVYVPWMLMTAGVSHFVVWGVWAFLFGSMGVIFALVSLAVFFHEGILWGKPGRDILLSIVAVLLGLGCTIHSFIPGMCVGWRAALPLHAFWHLFSSITANRLGHTLDILTRLVETIEMEPKKKQSGKSLLVRLVQCDLLPSQFSM